MANAEPITWDQLHAYIDELRVMARALLALEGNAQSLQPTALVLSALRGLVPGGTKRRTDAIDWDAITWPNRKYFFAAAYKAMRRALVDHARKRKKKRALRPVQIEEIHLENLPRTADEQPEQIAALLIALKRLRQQDPDSAELVEHRYFSGLTTEDAARVMDMSERTLRRRWEHVRVLLYREVRKILNEEDISQEAVDEAAD